MTEHCDPGATGGGYVTRDAFQSWTGEQFSGLPLFQSAFVRRVLFPTPTSFSSSRYKIVPFLLPPCYDDAEEEEKKD